ncbi:MAG TPA: YajQ family cyclic di-GMP-binding protein [Thermoanaerobaculia bacterium]|nr:YajQ family cyclic di-GMP-binding protein [Thermoanaerobaculia bacterium]
MAAENSFDVVSNVDIQEVRNAVDQAQRELGTRYDLKNAAAEVELAGEEIVIESSDEYTLGQAVDVLKTKLVRRSVDLKSLRPGKVEEASGGRARQKFELQQGIPTDTAKQIAAEVKKLKIKVQAAIQGDSVRITGKKRDDLQQVITHLKSLDLDVPLTFTNYRS